MASGLQKIDALLLLMSVIWGTNYSIVKSAFRKIDPQAFNALRMIIASTVFLLIIAGIRRAAPRAPAPERSAPEADADGVAGIFHTPSAITRRDWLDLAALGFVGHFLYQYLFIGGLARTSVANSSLLLAATPVMIAIFTAMLGQDRISPLHWTGAALSMFGVYLIVGGGAALGGDHSTGDVMMFGAVCCWAFYTIGARRLMTRHSPVGVTGVSMAIGTLLYVPVMSPRVRAVDWGAVDAATWIAIVYSALFALCVAYTIWYAAVRQIGSARTSVYSNIVPLIAMATAVLFLGEPLGSRKVAGAAAVLAGVALTRVGRRRLAIPAQE